MRTKILFSIAIGSAMLLAATNNLIVSRIDGISHAASVDNVSDISFSDDETLINVTANGNTISTPVDSLDQLTFGKAGAVVDIVYNGTDATVMNPYAFSGVSVYKTGADIVINSSLDSEIEYRLSGSTTDGSFKIYTAKKFILTLNGVSLTNADGAAINCQSDNKMTLHLADGTQNTLCDAAKYVTVTGEDMKGTVFSEGKINITGSGALTVVGLKKHGIVCDDDIIVDGGVITMTNVASDAFHSKDLFQINAGTCTLSTTAGDGVDGDEGFIKINGGTMNITVAGDTNKGIKSDSTITMTAGTVNINTSGNVVVEDGDPSYCTGVKSDGSFIMSGGSLTIVSTGEAGKGISVDKDIEVTGGTIDITTSGGGATYTDTTGTLDSYSATCIKADGDIRLMAGTISTASSGLAGKGISVDGTLTIGDGTSAPIVTAKTTGARFLVSGYGENADYANPKAIKAEGNLTINSGEVSATTTQNGGEGIESKSTLTINGGTNYINTYDDGINAATAIVVNGGKTYVQASGNDGVDSNGTITIAGGTLITIGTQTPEGGIDCDQNRFAITGGTLIALGGSNSKPTESACTQRSVIYQAAPTANQLIHIQDASGTDILTFMYPRSYSQGGASLLFSSPSIASGGSYTIYTGGSVSGGDTFHGYTTGGTYSGGTQAATFTSSSMITTIGGAGGGGGRPGRP